MVVNKTLYKKWVGLAVVLSVEGYSIVVEMSMFLLFNFKRIVALRIPLWIQFLANKGFHFASIF